MGKKKREMQNAKQNNHHPMVAISETRNPSLLMSFNNSQVRENDEYCDLHINQLFSTVAELCTREPCCNYIHASIKDKSSGF